MRFAQRAALLGAVLAVVVGCRTFNPTPMTEVGFEQRAETQTQQGVTASIVVLTAEEAKAAFDCKLYKKKIQPVWIEITNDTDDEMLFMPRSIDPEYFAPLEVAQKTHWRWSKQANTEKKYFYYENQMPFLIPPGETVSGFVFANRSRGVRWVLVEVFSDTTRSMSSSSPRSRASTPTSTSSTMAISIRPSIRTRRSLISRNHWPFCSG